MTSFWPAVQRWLPSYLAAGYLFLGVALGIALRDGAQHPERMSLALFILGAGLGFAIVMHARQQSRWRARE